MAAPAVASRLTGPDAALRRHLRREVRAHSPFWRDVIDRAGGLGASGEPPLARLPLTRVSDIADWGALVLRPTEESIARDGHRVLAARLAWSRAFGQQARFGRRVVDPAYKPLHWLAEKGTLVGYSAGDLAELAELGRDWLEQAGVEQDDVLVSLVPAGPRLGYWELVLGARRAGLSTIHLTPGVDGTKVASLHPTVLAGGADDVARVLDTASAARAGFDHVRTVLIVDDLPDREVRRRIRRLLPRADAAVVAAWAPPGARAMWTECRGGDQLHTSPDHEAIEVVDGELVWTGVGWAGTALVRWGTGVRGRVVAGPCGSCGRAEPRVLLSDSTSPRSGAAGTTDTAAVADGAIDDIGASDPVAGTLDAEPDVRWWRVDPLPSGTGVVVVLGVDDPESCGPLVRRLDRTLRDVAQFVVLAEDEDEDEDEDEERGRATATAVAGR